MLDSTHLTQTANTITTRIAELLCAPVFIVNDRGRVITSSDPQRVGRALSWEKERRLLPNFLRVPFYHQTEVAEIVVGESYNQERIPPRLAQALIELVINQTVTQTPSPTYRQLKNQLIYDLLHEQIDNEAAVLSRSQHLGMDLTQPRAVILIDAADYILQTDRNSDLYAEAAIHQRTQTVIESIVSFFHLPNDTICADLGQGNVCVLKASNTRNLDPWAQENGTADGISSSWANLAALKRAADALLFRLCNDTGASINIGIGRYHPGLRGLSRSYEDARAALSLGSRFRGRDRVHCLAELGIAAFVGVADEKTKIDLARYLLSPLDQESELLATLDVFFQEDCCPSSTAKHLSIHRNTLSYRLDKIASLTGLDPRKFDDAVQMRLSLLLRLLSR